MPTTIAAYARLDLIEEAAAYDAMDCIECGCCTYICPAAIPLVQSIRYAKAAILAKKKEGLTWKSSSFCPRRPISTRGKPPTG